MYYVVQNSVYVTTMFKNLQVVTSGENESDGDE